MHHLHSRQLLVSCSAPLLVESYHYSAREDWTLEFTDRLDLTEVEVYTGYLLKTAG
jgi:hypothetical protein